ncbi:aromatic ring-opening dioxygenase LigA [Streptomyces sp. NPDC091046]|uniref:aromatic ring-opening dioxygenase LigA n=1 Tax=Streptomyces sp. NPDC091046 TaxID=3365973 RepID=UPI00380DE7B1
MISAKARAELARILAAPPPEQVPGQAALDVPAEEKPPPSCEHGNPRCHARPVRPYPCGWKCDDHQPAKTHRRPT